MSRRPQKNLRKGYTTGACAAAASAAAFEALLKGDFPDPVTITLPRGERVSFALATKKKGEGPEGLHATAGIIKDAGDDPDVTHGAEIRATVRLRNDGGVVFRAGEGVGEVTRPGLALEVDEPAINPVPREMMRKEITAIAANHGVASNVTITISIPGGEKLARKTLNERLGIVGGLSILGTTGIVVPYSCAAWIEAIHRGVDVARAGGITHIAASTGRTSERGVQKLHGLQDAALVEMGDFAGGLLKYLRRHPVPKLTLAGGFAKISKLAAGHLDLHSRRSRVDLSRLSDHLRKIGANEEAVSALGANSAGALFDFARTHDLPLADHIAKEARQVAVEVLDNGDGTSDILVEIAIFDRGGKLVGRAGG
jgi:cobalt-precorrin-5B (C1)-methyltransferase